MKRFAIYLTCGLAVSVMTSCKIEKIDKDLGEYVKRELSAADFHEIENNSTFDVVYSIGDPKITVNCREKLYDNLDIKVRDGKLCINHKDKMNNVNFSSLVTENKAVIICSSPRLDKSVSNGTGDIKLHKVDVGNLSLISNGTGDIEWLASKADSVWIKSMGTGDVNLNANAVVMCDLELSGTGDVEAKNLKCTDLVISSTGTGDVVLRKVNVSNLEAISSGTGDITISGSVLSGKTENSGVGDINLLVDDKSKISQINKRSNGK